MRVAKGFRGAEGGIPDVKADAKACEETAFPDVRRMRRLTTAYGRAEADDCSAEGAEEEEHERNVR